MSEYIPILVFLIICIGLGSVIVFLSTLLGPKHRKSPVKMDTFECGSDPIGSPRVRFSVKFYVIALLFVIFDIEAVFMYPWAIRFRELGLFGFVEMLVFILILFSGLIYVWKKGAVDFYEEEYKEHNAYYKAISAKENK